MPYVLGRGPSLWNDSLPPRGQAPWFPLVGNHENTQESFEESGTASEEP